MKNNPREIKRLETRGVSISWSDGAKQEISSKILRENCPCATCNERRGDSGHQNPLGPKKTSSLKIIESSLKEETELLEIWPVGNYALGMRWGDNHSSGIYTYDYLRALS